VKPVAADAKILINAAILANHPALAPELLFAPPVREAHLLRLAAVNGNVDRIPAAAGENLFKRFFVEIAERQPGLQAARVDVAVGLNRHLRTGAAQKV